VVRSPPDGFEHFGTDHPAYADAGSWYQLVGPLYRRLAAPQGPVTLGFFSEPRHLNYLKQVHGGMMSAFMDYVLWSTARSVWPDAAVVTISMTVDFIAICPEGAWVTGEGELIRAGGTVAFVRAVARTGEGVVAHASGTYRRIGR
jgi:acyl-coenzyme A thioesterase PaaI-like protein